MNKWDSTASSALAPCTWFNCTNIAMNMSLWQRLAIAAIIMDTIECSAYEHGTFFFSLNWNRTIRCNRNRSEKNDHFAYRSTRLVFVFIFTVFGNSSYIYTLIELNFFFRFARTTVDDQSLKTYKIHIIFS